MVGADESWPRARSSTPLAAAAPPGWRGLLSMAHATTDPASAWAEENGLAGWDDGNGQANKRWWVASRP